MAGWRESDLRWWMRLLCLPWAAMAVNCGQPRSWPLVRFSDDNATQLAEISFLNLKLVSTSLPKKCVRVASLS
jgi:hypothetical protein